MNKGFTLLFASLIASLFLSLGLAIANITLSQLILSSAGRDSQFAFYNADTGVECALYYENKVENSDGSSFFPTDYRIHVPSSIDCGDGPVAGTMTHTGTGNFATTTTTYVINPSTSCDASSPSFTVEIHKKPALPTGTYYTTIQSRGYNTCDAASPRRVERGLQVVY